MKTFYNITLEEIREILSSVEDKKLVNFPFLWSIKYPFIIEAEAVVMNAAF